MFLSNFRHSCRGSGILSWSSKIAKLVCNWRAIQYILNPNWSMTFILDLNLPLVV